MSVNLAAPLRTALVQDASISAFLSTWEDEPSVHTRRPAPADATYPLAMVGPDAASGDEDGLTGSRPVITRDIIVYGNQPDDYRAVEACAYLIKELFHRNRFAITVPDYRVVAITATGPIPAPTDDENKVARAVTVTIQLQKVP